MSHACIMMYDIPVYVKIHVNISLFHRNGNHAADRQTDGWT